MPPYQRAYSWQVGNGDQVGQFLRDLREQDPSHPYYLGHFLFEAGDASNAMRLDGLEKESALKKGTARPLGF